MKQFSPNEVTDEGIMIDVKLLQPEKQYSPNEVTDEGIMIDVKLLQSKYLEVIDSQLFAVNTVEKWIGCYLWVYGKWRFNDFNLLWLANVRFGWQNEGREEK